MLPTYMKKFKEGVLEEGWQVVEINRMTTNMRHMGLR